MSKGTDQFSSRDKGFKDPDCFDFGFKRILSGFSEFLEPCDVRSLKNVSKALWV